jgi:hypothetical protein
MIWGPDNPIWCKGWLRGVQLFGLYFLYILLDDIIAYI